MEKTVPWLEIIRKVLFAVMPTKEFTLIIEKSINILTIKYTINAHTFNKLTLLLNSLNRDDHGTWINQTS